jgi:hypothetical protein
VRRAVYFLFALIWTADVAWSQDISGQWYGILEGYTAGDPKRVLEISFKDNVATCTWDAGATIVGARAPCTIQNGTVELVTAAKNPVRLALEGTELKGNITFLPRNDTHRITMKRTTVSRAGPQQSVTACEQTLKYRISPVPELPSSLSAFLGAWVGDFRNWCTILIVESISADGTAQVRQGWARSDANRRGAPGSETYEASISGNTLTIRKRNWKEEYFLVAPNQIEAKRHMEIYMTQGTFVRQ